MVFNKGIKATIKCKRCGSLIEKVNYPDETTLRIYYPKNVTIQKTKSGKLFATIYDYCINYLMTKNCKDVD